MNLFFWADYLRTYEISHPYALVNIVSGLHRWVNGKNSKFFAFDSTNHVSHFHNGQLEPANKYFLNKSSIVYLPIQESVSMSMKINVVGCCIRRVWNFEF